MKSLLIIVALGGAASAAPLVTPPAGWKGGADVELVQLTGGAGHFGGEHGIVEAESYKPDKPGIVLDVARVTLNTSTAASAAKAELESLKNPKVTPDAATKQIEAMLEQTGDVHQKTRIVIVATKDKIVEVQGDCIAGDAAAPWDACVAALATIDPGIAPADRVAIDLANPSPSPSPSPSSSTSTSTSTMSDGSRVPMPPIVVKPDTSSPSTDERPFFVGAGIVLLAVVFWWNRRRRERFLAEERGESSDAPKEYQ